MTKYLSVDELYRYLYISKRKLKYLLENDYIPCIDTGKKTHRFLIKTSDAKEFKRRMDTEPGFFVGAVWAIQFWYLQAEEEID